MRTFIKDYLISQFFIFGYEYVTWGNVSRYYVILTKISQLFKMSFKKENEKSFFLWIKWFSSRAKVVSSISFNPQWWQIYVSLTWFPCLMFLIAVINWVSNPHSIHSYAYLPSKSSWYMLLWLVRRLITITLHPHLWQS